MDDGTQQKDAAVRIGRVLVGGNDVRAALEEEARDRSDDPRLIRAPDQEAPDLVRVDSSRDIVWERGRCRLGGGVQERSSYELTTDCPTSILTGI
jgi:hypothetical protein